MHICPRCGATEGTKKFIGPFCVDCYCFKIDIPEGMELQQCKRCLRVRMHGKWVPFSEKKVEDYVKAKFRGEFRSAEFSLLDKKAVFTVDREGSNAQIEKYVDFELRPDICPDCNKKAGGYFEAIIQLRGNEARIQKYFRIFDKELEEAGTFISKIVEQKEGLDLYVGSTKTTLAVIKELGLTHKISTKLAGQKQGKRLYRTTFAIRL